MKILLFGSSNVGKSTTGKLLAKRLNYKFYDLDDEIKKLLKITLEEFVSTRTLLENDQIRCNLIMQLVAKKENMVLAITPLSYIQPIQPLLSQPDILSIELIDDVESIFDRLVFSDENDIAYTDNVYKNKYKKHYLSEIAKDLAWYGRVYNHIVKYRFNMDGNSTSDVVERIIAQYHLVRLDK